MRNEPQQNLQVAKSVGVPASPQPTRVNIITEEALKVAKIFWEMTDLAIDDNENNVTIDGVNDLEFWMHKLFNKVSGYLKKQGYEAQWDQATDEYDAG